MNKPQTVQEPTTKVHDIEVMTANLHNNSFDFAESKDIAEFRRSINFSKNSTKEARSISNSSPIWSMGNLKLEYKNSAPFKGGARRHAML